MNQISTGHRAGLISVIAVGIGLLIVLFTLNNESSTQAYTINKQIQYGFTIQNKTNQTLKNRQLWVHAPVKKTSIQKVLKITSSHPYEMISDKLGNQFLKYTFDKFPPYATRIIRIKAELGLSVKPGKTNARNLKAFTNSEKTLELGHPRIKERAVKLKKFRTINTAQKVHQWVAKHIKYSGYVKNERGALYALDRGKGDCTEYMHLYTALNRVNNIPTRMIGGYICRESRVVKPVDYHNWAEFYHGGKWHVVDPQNRVFMKDYSDYIAMRIIHETPENKKMNFDRFKVLGRGLKVKMND